MRSLRFTIGVFVCAYAVHAQTDRGTITGTVSDPAGAVVANAAVDAKNTATGANYAAASSATGNYTIAQLPVGTYDLTVSRARVQEISETGHHFWTTFRSLHSAAPRRVSETPAPRQYPQPFGLGRTAARFAFRHR